MTQRLDRPAVALPSGQELPLLGFGTWQLRGREAYDAVRCALEVGYRHLDTATAYGNEAQIGEALADSAVPREEVVVTTKLRPQDAGRERETLEASRRALGLDAVDLWLIHWPPDGDPGLATWRQLLALHQEGRAANVGVSNYRPAQVDQLGDATGVAPAVNQVRWSPSLYDPDRLAHSRDRGVVLEGYSPFRASDLDDPTLADIAAAHGVTPAQVILRWHLDHRVPVIPKSANPARIHANADLFGFALDPEERARLDGLSGSH